MDRYTADLTVAEIAAIRAAERRRLATVPTPLTAFGLVNLGGSIATILIGRYHLALYGVPAFATAVWLSARAFRQRARSEGVQVAVRPWALTAAALCVACASVSRAGAMLDIEALSTVGPFLAQATGLWLLGRWADSDALLAAAVFMVIGSALIGSVAAGDLAVGLQFVIYGALLLAFARYVTVGRSTR